jgi:hypothetical protein
MAGFAGGDEVRVVVWGSAGFHWCAVVNLAGYVQAAGPFELAQGTLEEVVASHDRPVFACVEPVAFGCVFASDA